MLLHCRTSQRRKGQFRYFASVAAISGASALAVVGWPVQVIGTVSAAQPAPCRINSVWLHDSRYAGDIVEAIDTIVRYQSEHHPETELEEQIQCRRGGPATDHRCGSMRKAQPCLERPQSRYRLESHQRISNIVHKYWQFDRNIAESVITVHLDPLRNVADSES